MFRGSYYSYRPLGHLCPCQRQSPHLWEMVRTSLDPLFLFQRHSLPWPLLELWSAGGEPCYYFLSLFFSPICEFCMDSIGILDSSSQPSSSQIKPIGVLKLDNCEV